MSRADACAAMAFVLSYSAFALLGHPIAGLLPALALTVIVGCFAEEYFS